MKKIYYAFVVLVFSQAQAACPSGNMATPPHKIDATASLWANMGNKPGSIRHEINTLLSDFFTGAQTNTQVTLQAMPQKFLTAYDDQKKCDLLLSQTKTTPIKFTPDSFDTLKSLQDWIFDFSKGNGKEGKLLYKKCDGTCSPQYHYQITKTARTGYEITADVICGHARDKKDNMYILSGTCTDLHTK